MRALDYLSEQQLLEVKAQGVRNRYTLLKRCDDLDGLAAQLHAKSVEREQRDIARLGEVIELANHDSCQVAALCHHFGETLGEPCGHCTWCNNERRAVSLPRSPEQRAG